MSRSPGMTKAIVIPPGELTTEGAPMEGARNRGRSWVTIRLSGSEREQSSEETLRVYAAKDVAGQHPNPPFIPERSSAMGARRDNRLVLTQFEIAFRLNLPKLAPQGSPESSP